MSHVRIGHIQYPVPERESRNAPTNAALPVLDDRIVALKDWLAAKLKEAQSSALNAMLATDTRSQNLGAYWAFKAASDKILHLFRHEIAALTEPQPQTEQPSHEKEPH